MQRRNARQLNAVIRPILNHLYKQRSILMALSVIVVFAASYLLILPALTLEQNEAVKQGGIDVPKTEQGVDSGEIDQRGIGEINSDAPESDAGDSAEAEAVTGGDGTGEAAGELAFEGEGYQVSVAADAKAGLPQDTELMAEEITANDEDYDAWRDEALKAVQEAEGADKVGDLKFAKFYDISLISGDGVIEPAAPVDVNISYDKALKVSDADHLRIVHFDVDKKGNLVPEVLDPKSVQFELKKGKMSGTAFAAESFSVYGVVYTVDFHYEVNGETFDYSIEGGSVITLTQLVKALGIADGNEKALVADVERVEFSSPDLVWVGKAENETTIGALKKINEIECQYTAYMTKEMISEIDAQKVSAGDWALISLRPFDTEEQLTVTMKNGDVWTIGVTDANVEVGSGLFDDIQAGKYFYLYTYYEGDQGANMAATRGDYYLKYDGSSKQLDPSLHDTEDEIRDELSNDYLWQLIWEEDSNSYYGGSWKIRNAGQPDYYLTLEDYYTITSTNSNQGINIIVKTADNTDGLLFLGNADEEYYAYYESEYDFSGFSFDNENSGLKLIFNNSSHAFDVDSSAYVYLGATIKAVSVDNLQPVITYTQDDIDKGYVSFKDETNSLQATNSDQLTISQDTTSSGQSRYMVTAHPAEGYHLVEWQVVSGNVTAWGDSSSKTAQSTTIHPIITGGGATIKAVFAPNQTISATQNDIERGHVEYNNGTDVIASSTSETIINVPMLGPTTEGEYRTQYNVTAVPADDYRFVKWEVVSGDVVSWGRDGSMTEYTTQINPYTTGGELTLRAVFERIPTGTTLDPSSAAGELVNQLMRELREDSADFKKTAHVVDEDKRIYQVNMSASSERKVIGPNMTLTFITDISRSMYFPANLTPVEYTQNDNVQPTNLESWLKGQGPNSEGEYNTYYMIADINGTATVLALFHDSDGNWKTMDASYYDDYFHDGEQIGTSGNYRSAPPNSRKGGFSAYGTNGNVTWGYLRSDGGGAYSIRTGGSYDGGYSDFYPITDLDSRGNIRLYTASSTSDEDGEYFTRLDYLKKAVKIISDVIYAVDEDAKIGLVTFAKKSYTRNENGTYRSAPPDSEKKNYVAELYGKDDGFPGLDNIVLTGGTRQDHGLETASDMDWYGLNADHPQTAILITDGAPNVSAGLTGADNPWGSLIEPRATDLKNKDVELYTLGLSLGNVGDNKQKLYHIAGKKGDRPGTWNSTTQSWSGIDSKYQNNAETGEEAISRLMEMLRSMEVVGNLLGSVSDTVDPAFYPVDANGYPIEEGVYNEQGTRLGAINDYLNEDGTPRQFIRNTYTQNPLYSTNNTVKYYTWKKDNGQWTITWYNQLINKKQNNDNPGWEKNFRVKAKEDFLGGNAINTNKGEALLTADRFTQQQYPDSIGTFGEPVTAAVGTPRVNVVELGLDENSTEWTVYLDTPVNSRQELESLYNKILVHERVTKADSDNRIDRSDPQNLGQHCLPNDANANTIPLNEELTLTSAEWDSLMAGETITHHYAAYGHKDVGIVKVELIKEGLNRKKVFQGEHPASPVGDNSEKYTLKITYTPNPEDPSTTWNTTPNESRGRVAEEINSTNQHIVNVFAEPIRVLKKDDSGNDVRGATFSLYRKAKSGETGVSLADYDEALTESYYCIDSQTTNYDGIAVLAQPSNGQNSKNLLVPGETYYLIETAAPANYKRDTTVRTVTVETAYDSYTNLERQPVASNVYPRNWTEGVVIKVNGTPAVVVDSYGNTATLTDGEGNERTYVLSDDPVTFQTEILNIRITDFRFKKISSDGNGLPGAVFQLKAIKNGSEVLVTEDPDYAGVTGVSESLDVEIDGETRTIQSAFITTGNEQIIGSLKDGTYILEEVYVPAGYIKTIGQIRFTITEGIMRMDMGGTLPDDIVFIPGKQTVTDPTLAFLSVSNTPGEALPSAGGPGTTWIYLIGSILLLACSTILIARRRVGKAS